MKYKIRKKKLIIFITICIGIVFWLVCKLCFHRYAAIGTQIAILEETQDVLTATGLVIRDELEIENKFYNRENLEYLLKDGDRVAVNDLIAKIYDNPDCIKIHSKVKKLEHDIKILEKLNFAQHNVSKGINFINKQINEEINGYLTHFGDNNVLEIENSRKKLLYLLNERQIVLGKDINIKGKLNCLKLEKEKLLNSCPKSRSCIKSSNSGIFISNIDGYEKSLNYDNVLNSDFNFLNFNEGAFDVNKIYKSNSIGKIIKSDVWYILCKVKKEEISSMRIGDTVKVTVLSFDFASELPCKIEHKSENLDSDDAILIISCDYMNKELASLRKEDFKIILNEYRGYKIPKNAIRKSSVDDGNNFGVYVNSKGYLKFKKVNPIFWGRDYVMCSPEALDENYLQIGESIVVEGISLYENRRI